jgi:hypothetical protein
MMLCQDLLPPKPLREQFDVADVRAASAFVSGLELVIWMRNNWPINANLHGRQRPDGEHGGWSKNRHYKHGCKHQETRSIPLKLNINDC